VEKVAKNVPNAIDHSDDIEPGLPPWCKDCGADVSVGRWVANGNGARRKGECKCSRYEWIVWRHPVGWRELNGEKRVKNKRPKRMYISASFDVRGE